MNFDEWCKTVDLLSHPSNYDYKIIAKLSWDYQQAKLDITTEALVFLSTPESYQDNKGYELREKAKEALEKIK